MFSSKFSFLNFDSRKSVYKSNMNFILEGDWMLCKYCNGYFSYSFSHGLTVTEICLKCGNVENCSRIFKSLI